MSTSPQPPPPPHPLHQRFAAARELAKSQIQAQVAGTIDQLFGYILDEITNNLKSGPCLVCHRLPSEPLASVQPINLTVKDENTRNGTTPQQQPPEPAPLDLAASRPTAPPPPPGPSKPRIKDEPLDSEELIEANFDDEDEEGEDIEDEESDEDCNCDKCVSLQIRNSQIGELDDEPSFGPHLPPPKKLIRTDEAKSSENGSENIPDSSSSKTTTQRTDKQALIVPKEEEPESQSLNDNKSKSTRTERKDKRRSSSVGSPSKKAKKSSTSSSEKKKKSSKSSRKRSRSRSSSRSRSREPRSRNRSYSRSRSRSPRPAVRSYYSKIDRFFTESINCLVSGCSVACPSKDEIDKHMIDEHKLYPHRCVEKHCEETFPTKSGLLHHMRHVHRALHSWECYSCRERFPNPTVLGRHIFFTHQEGFYRCAYAGCAYTSKYRCVVYNHYDAVHGDPEAAAPRRSRSRSRSLDDKSSVKKSSATERAKPKPKCKYNITSLKCIFDDCAEFFLDTESLNRHLDRSHDCRPIQCPALRCRRSFDEKSQLDRHVRFDHSVISQWRCSKCELVFDDYNLLYTHRYRSHQEGAFTCSVKGCTHKVGKYRADIIEHYDKEHAKKKKSKPSKDDKPTINGQ